MNYYFEIFSSTLVVVLLVALLVGWVGKRHVKPVLCEDILVIPKKAQLLGSMLGEHTRSMQKAAAGVQLTNPLIEQMGKSISPQVLSRILPASGMGFPLTSYMSFGNLAKDRPDFALQLMRGQLKKPSLPSVGLLGSAVDPSKATTGILPKLVSALKSSPHFPMGAPNIPQLEQLYSNLRTASPRSKTLDPLKRFMARLSDPAQSEKALAQLRNVRVGRVPRGRLSFENFLTGGQLPTRSLRKPVKPGAMGSLKKVLLRLLRRR